MTDHPVVDRDQWLAARLELLEREKALTRERDAVTRARQALPWVRIDKDYRFETQRGEESLIELFDGRSQLIVYHFMFGPDWEEGCMSCSLVAEGFDGAAPHLAARDVTLKAVSRAPLDKLIAFRDRLGWKFDWASSLGSEFNRDFHVQFSEAELEGEAYYNYETGNFPSTEAPGLSAFVRDGEAVYHTYSCYSRGLDALMPVYQYLDVAPLGRREDDLDFTMEWVRHHDRYDDQENR